MSDAQLSLWKWGKFYRSVYEMMPTDRPEDHVINDDAALDAWYTRYTKDITMKAAKLKGNANKQAAAKGPVDVSKLPKIGPDQGKVQG